MVINIAVMVVLITTIVCLLGFNHVCPVSSAAINAPILLVGLATMLPVMAVIMAYFADLRRENEEMRGLLYV